MISRLGCGGGGGGGGNSLGFGGSMNSLRISTGMTTSAARRSKPLCSAQSAATWNNTTPPAMTALRERPRAEVGEEEKRSDTIKIRVRVLQKVPDAAEPLLAYLRKIHQTEPVTKIKLPPSAERSSMLCFPGWSWQAGSSSARIRNEARRPDARRCTARPHRVRNLRTGRIGWLRQVQTALRRKSCPRAHDGRFHGQRLGGRRRRSWR